MTFHARLSPSKAHRWRRCPGSPRLEEPFPDTSGPHADEGSAAHVVGEQMLKGETRPIDVVHLPGDRTVKVTAEMIAGAKLYAETCIGLARGHKYHSEAWVSLEELAKRAGVVGLDGGTADFMCYHPDDNTLDIADLKFGKGVVVDADDNEQLLLYALAAALKILQLTKKPLAGVRVTIVQPRAEHRDGPVRTVFVTWDELILFSKEIIAAAQETQREDAPLVPGEKQCKWCKAKAVCPALAGKTTALVQASFEAVAAVPVEADAMARIRPLPHPEHLTEDQLSAIIAASPMIRDFLNAVSEHVTTILKEGGEFPGYKLVEGRRSRDWTDEEAAAKYLQRKLGAPVAFVRKLISPAQAEKALKASEGEIPARLEKLIVTNQGNPILAPESNPKPAINPKAEAQNAFSVITEETETSSQ